MRRERSSSGAPCRFRDLREEQEAAQHAGPCVSHRVEPKVNARPPVTRLGGLILGFPRLSPDGAAVADEAD